MGFFEGLTDNIRAASESALIKSVVGDPDQTIGEILTALDNEKDAKYLLEAFREITIGQIVQAAMENIEAMMNAATENSAPVEDEPEPEVPKPAARSTAKAKSGKAKKAPKKVTASDAPDLPEVTITTPDGRKAYESAILKALKNGPHVDKKSGISSQNLRKIVGGAAPQAREILNELIAAGRVKYTGVARGTKYYLFD
jgi:hypothetical protein